MSQSLKSLMDQIDSSQKAANIDLANIPSATRPGFEMRKNQAKEELPGLISRLQKNLIPSHLYGLVVFGDAAPQQQTADFITQNGGIAVNAAQMYRIIADKIEPSFGKDRLYRTDQFMGTVLKCEDIVRGLGWQGVSLNYLETYCPTYEDTLSHVRTLIQNSVGNRLLVAYLAREIVEAAVTSRITDDRIPVVVTGANTNDIGDLRSLFVKANTHTFAGPDDTATPELVVSLLKSAS